MSWINEEERKAFEQAKKDMVNSANLPEKVENSLSHLPIDESTVRCPDSGKAQYVMCGWGKKKRQTYARLVEERRVSKHEAFYFVEFNNGEEI